MNLITGVTGNFGLLAAQKYLQGNKDLAVLARSADRVDTGILEGAEIRIGDYGDYGSLVNAFSGIEKLLFVSSNDLDNRLTHHTNVINAAVETGVKHLVFTSFQYQSTASDSPNLLMPVYAATEKMLAESGLNYTILRNGIYMELLPDIIGYNIRETKTLFAPGGSTAVSFTSRADLAEAAVKVLLSGEYSNSIIDLTNSSAETLQQVADIVANLLHEKVTYVDPGDEKYRSTLLEAGLPVPVVELFAGILASMKAGEFEKTTPDLERILGRNPVSVAEYLKSIYG